MLNRIRKFSEFQKFSIDPNRIIPRASEKDPKQVYGIKQKSDKMKSVFGKDYESPYEKYDTQIPRTSIYDGPKSQETRFHEKNNYKQMRTLAKFTFALSFLTIGYFMYLVHADTKKFEEARQEYVSNAVTKQLILEKFNKAYESRVKHNEKNTD